MSAPGPIDRERARALMMAALDGEATPDERRELEALLAGSEELRQEWTRLGRVREATAAMTLKEPPEEVWDRYWGSVYNRAERGVAWLLLSLGAIVLGAWGLWRWLEAVIGEPDLPWPIRTALLAVAAGLAVLVVSVIRERFLTRRHDRYDTEVRR